MGSGGIRFVRIGVIEDGPPTGACGPHNLSCASFRASHSIIAANGNASGDIGGALRSFGFLTYTHGAMRDNRAKHGGGSLAVLGGEALTSWQVESSADLEDRIPLDQKPGFLRFPCNALFCRLSRPACHRPVAASAAPSRHAPDVRQGALPFFPQLR